MNKKIISAATVFTITLGMACTTAFADELMAKEVIDLNNDGKCNVQDILAVSSAIKEGRNSADINGDGKTDINDLLEIASIIKTTNDNVTTEVNTVKVCSGIIPYFGIGEMKEFEVDDSELNSQLVDWYEAFKAEGREAIHIDVNSDTGYEPVYGGYVYYIEFTAKDGSIVKLYRTYAAKGSENFFALNIEGNLYLGTAEEEEMINSYFSYMK